MTEPLHLLVVDDEPSIRHMLQTVLKLNGYRVTTARTGREALALTQTIKFDGIISDVYMPDGDGLEVVRALRSISRTMPIILMTAQGSLDLAVRAVAEGASDFIAKPFEMAAMMALVKRYLAAQHEAKNATPDSETLAQEFSRSGLIGRSPAMVKVYKLIAHAARTDATVLVTGESGTGKELVARAIHDFSARSKKPFLAVNCSGLTDTLLEAELFGHTKGSFTGAMADRAGLFETADGGTLFLDELASTSAAFQASLLRVLQSGEVRRVGSTQTRRFNVRVIGASNAPLDELAQAGVFRADLYYRLSVLTIDLPPLRDRAGDIELLARYFLQPAGNDSSHDFQLSFRLTQEAAAVLQAYTYPGNVRELQNALTRAMVLSADGIITLDCLPPRMIVAETLAADSEAEANQPQDDVRALVADHPTLAELQRRYVEFILNEVGGHRRRAAEKLGVNLRTIYRLLERYQLSAVDDEDEAATANDHDDAVAPEQDDHF